jgi:hypothetical protein
MTLDMLITLVYSLVGISGAFSFLVFSWGLAAYIAAIGTERRVGGINIMLWGVEIMFGTFALIGLLYFLQWVS